MRTRNLNTFRVSVEQNQSGKWAAQIEARYAPTRWTLRVYFLATNPASLVNRLLRAVRFLQREEEKLWIWGSDPSDRELLFDQLLEQAGLQLDRRRDFPRRAVSLAVPAGQSFRPLHLAELKRRLSERLAPAPRVTVRPTVASRKTA